MKIDEPNFPPGFKEVIDLRAELEASVREKFEMVPRIVPHRVSWAVGYVGGEQRVFRDFPKSD